MSESTNLVRLTALADAYGMLALMTQFPTNEMLIGLADGTLREDALAILTEIGLDVDDARIETLKLQLETASREARDKDALSVVRREYTRLFNHPDAPALGLFEELFIHVRKHRLANPDYIRDHDKEPRTFVNDASFDAERCFKNAGFVRTEKTSTPSDCMFVEMQFMQCLFARMTQANLENNDALYAETLEHAHEFKRLHLDKWMKRFYEDCATEGHLAFFGALGCFGSLVYDLTCDYLV